MRFARREEFSTVTAPDGNRGFPTAVLPSLRRTKFSDSQDHIATPRLPTIKQTAAYCSGAVWAVRQLAWSKELRSLRIGNRILIDRGDIDALIERRRRERT